MLEMKTDCGICGAKLAHDSDALICSFECTYCAECAKVLNFICKNCDGELLKRPKRAIRR